jgi:hypothetical protein
MSCLRPSAPGAARDVLAPDLAQHAGEVAAEDLRDPRVGMAARREQRGSRRSATSGSRRPTSRTRSSCSGWASRCAPTRCARATASPGRTPAPAIATRPSRRIATSSRARRATRSSARCEGRAPRQGAREAEGPRRRAVIRGPLGDARVAQLPGSAGAESLRRALRGIEGRGARGEGQHPDHFKPDALALVVVWSDLGCVA